MSIDTQLCAFKTADNERLHGLLFTPPQSPSDLALIMVHGVAMNFYLPPLVIFGLWPEPDPPQTLGPQG